MKRPALLAVIVMILLQSAFIAGAQEAKVDIVFVIDETGSMGDDIDAVKERVSDIVSRLEGVDARLAIVAFRDWPCCGYGDPGDCPARIHIGFTSDRGLFMEALYSLQAKGGGDDPESQLTALWAAVTLLDWRPDAYKVIILMTDAPYHEPSPDECVLANCIDAWESCVGGPRPPANLTLDYVMRLADEAGIGVIYVLLPARSITLEEVYSSIGVVRVYTEPEEAATVAEEVASLAAETARAIASVEVAETYVYASPEGIVEATVILENMGGAPVEAVVEASLAGEPCEPPQVLVGIPPGGVEAVNFTCPAPPLEIADLAVYVNGTLTYTMPVNITYPYAEPGPACNEILVTLARLEERLEQLEAALNTSCQCPSQPKCDQEAVTGAVERLAYRIEAMQEHVDTMMLAILVVALSAAILAAVAAVRR